MTEIKITDIIAFEIEGNADLCAEFHNLVLSRTPDGELLINCSLRGGHSGMGRLLNYFSPEARPALERFAIKWITEKDTTNDGS